MTSWALESSMLMARPGNPSAKSRGKVEENFDFLLLPCQSCYFSIARVTQGVNCLCQHTKNLLLHSSYTPLTNTLFRPHFQTSEFKDAALINKHVDGLLVLIDKHIATKPDTPLEVQVSIHPMFLSHK